MTEQEIINSAKESFDSAMAHLEKEFSGIHSGRASTSLVENIQIDTYGSKQPLKGLAQITVSEATQLTVQPWDQGLVETISNTIADSGLGLNPNNDGRVIRINIPPLTEERRSDMAKLIKKMAEAAKVTVRNAREDARKTLKRLKEDSVLSEDGLEAANDSLQKIVDEYNSKIEEKEKAKEADIMTV